MTATATNITARPAAKSAADFVAVLHLLAFVARIVGIVRGILVLDAVPQN